MVELSDVLETIESSGAIQDIATLDPAKTFKDNGIDSLDVMSMFLAIEERFKTKFTDEEVNQIKTVPELVDALNARS